MEYFSVQMCMEFTCDAVFVFFDACSSGLQYVMKHHAVDAHFFILIRIASMMNVKWIALVRYQEQSDFTHLVPQVKDVSQEYGFMWHHIVPVHIHDEVMVIW